MLPRLWTRMRGLTNNQITQINLNDPQFVYNQDGIFQDTILYPRLYSPQDHATFDKSLREKLGFDPRGLEYILIDSYDIDNNTIEYYDKDGTLHTMNVENNLLTIDMFSADELLEDGRYTAYYYGYDYKGNKLTERPSLDDFFTELDDRGDYARRIPAFEPIYMAGYIQDKFAFNDLIFNVGLRVDRFDANQPVLKDPFLLYEARTVSEVNSIGGLQVNIPVIWVPTM